MEPVTLAIVGAGARGAAYARLAAQAGAVVVAVAESDARVRAAVAGEFGLGPEAVFEGWQALAAQARLADAAVIATPDRVHADPAVALAALGYDLLLEKPMAPTQAEAERIVEAVRTNDVLLAVCHVLRYSTYTKTLKALLDAGAVGEIVSVEHLEPVGWWHQAHSYVRGQWAVEDESSSMLLAKSGHDIDWLGYVIGRAVERVSSFGGLYHFRPEHKPAGAADRCLDCVLQAGCAYSAPLIYRRFLGDPVGERWPLSVLTADLTEEGLDRALREGPYGRCVYNGGNDVVDHQVVSLEYAGGVTASFTMTGFSVLDFRKTRIFGTTGCIEGDGRELRIHDFVTDAERTVGDLVAGGASASDGHGGADGELVRDFLTAVARRDRSLLRTGPQESLDSHRVVWAAERARRDGTVVTL